MGISEVHCNEKSASASSSELRYTIQVLLELRLSFMPLQLFGNVAMLSFCLVGGSY